MTDVNTSSVEAEPFLVDEGRVIYFTSDRPGGLGGRDMWRAVRADAASAFGTPEPVTELNSSADEQDPWLTQDERVIFFASDRAGNWEIYQASR